MPAATIDYAGVKASVNMMQAIDFLHIQITGKDNPTQLRAKCPRCANSDKRGLSMNTQRNLFTCFAAKAGVSRGDVIALVAHVHGVGQPEAATMLSDHFGLGNGYRPADTGSRKARAPEPTDTAGVTPVRAMEPLLYLDAHHEALKDIGVSPETLEHFKSGYAGKGTMRGRLAVPIRLSDGTLIAYVGIAVSEDQHPRLLYHEKFVPSRHLFNVERVSTDDIVSIARDPLEVLQHYEGGVENVIAFLSPITSDALTVLSVWMETNNVENVEIL